MVETLIVVTFFTLVLLALFHYSQLVTAKLVLDHAAARAARARAVGMNDFMVTKTVRAAAIPVSGPCLSVFDGDERLGAWEERARVPRYLATEDAAEAAGCLDYERWGQLVRDVSAGLSRVTARVGLGRVAGSYAIENHAATYLNDEGR